MSFSWDVNCHVPYKVEVSSVILGTCDLFCGPLQRE